MDRNPRVLLVEDDAVSSSVFTLALERAGAHVDARGCVATAHDAATHAHHDLWLIDAHLPDGTGIDLLASLRARGLFARAIAHTASSDPALHARLRDAGFVDVLVKPLPAAELVAAVLPSSSVERRREPADRWDDPQALRALGGRRESLLALRALFLQELPDALARCRTAVHTHDDAALRATLHRLQASCAFVGAATLLECVHALRGAPGPSTLAEFEREVGALLARAPTDVA
ncbi:Hpt domain-containing response regulator [Cognatilysobacter bugurensis]|uniref:Transcriptional regulator n=1 Tax=Cognatilysobacter bugurensis TaxID=543356 RepID=A0A918ST32_9GAMM|nr:response regulator [Lysobacter bugurensis]GHA70014.1 transcriptional regulator [Lysobacter bugurensis]